MAKQQKPFIIRIARDNGRTDYFHSYYRGVKRVYCPRHAKGFATYMDGVKESVGVQEYYDSVRGRTGYEARAEAVSRDKMIAACDNGWHANCRGGYCPNALAGAVKAKNSFIPHEKGGVKMVFEPSWYRYTEAQKDNEFHDDKITFEDAPRRAGAVFTTYKFKVGDPAAAKDVCARIAKDWNERTGDNVEGDLLHRSLLSFKNEKVRKYWEGI